MLDGTSVASAFSKLGITHVVWIPDSVLGTWEAALLESEVQLIRVCREGEAFAVAAGLYLGGQRPIVCIQCTGFFEAGDALRNVVHDLKIPLFMIVGVRSYYAHQQGTSADSCPVFTEPILRAWQIDYDLFDERSTADDLIGSYSRAQQENRPGAILLAE